MYAEDWPQETLSDLARIRRDHEFLRVLAAAVAKQGLGNPITDLNLINSVKSDLTFDQSWAVSDMANLVLDFHSVTSTRSPAHHAGGGGHRSRWSRRRPPQYQGGTTGTSSFRAAPGPDAIDQVLGIGPGIDPMTGSPLPASATVAVSVVNGTGTYNQAPTRRRPSPPSASTWSAWATRHPSGTCRRRTCLRIRSPAVEAAAERVAHSMSGSVIMAYDPSQVTDGAEVTVVTGTQFTVNAPPAPPAPRPPPRLPGDRRLSRPRRRHRPRPHPRHPPSRPRRQPRPASSHGIPGPARRAPPPPPRWPTPPDRPAGGAARSGGSERDQLLDVVVEDLPTVVVIEILELGHVRPSARGGLRCGASPIRR